MKRQTKLSKRSIINAICAVTLTIALLAFPIIYFGVCPKKYADFIESACKKYDLTEETVYAVIKVESGFNRNAKSAKGAIGLMQILPSTAEYICPDETEIDLYDPKTNVYVGAKYLSYLFNKFNDERVALAAYNAGEGNVINWLSDENYSENGKTLSVIPFSETRAYVEKVLKFKRLYKILYKPFQN